MKILALFLFAVSFLFPQNSGWKILETGTANNLFDILFVNPDTGVAVGENGVILRSTNGGANWDIYQQLGNDLLSISFTEGELWVAGSEGALIKSDDYGLTWNDKSFDSTLSIGNVFFVDKNLGFIEANSYILKTTNGGDNWEVILTDQTNEFRSLFFISENLGWAAGWKLYNTTNAGGLWNSIEAPGNLTYVQFTSDSIGWGVIMGGFFSTSICKTTDGGATWETQLFTSEGKNVLAVELLNDQTGFAAGDYGRIWKTTDSGENWIMQDSVTSSRLFAVSFADLNTGYICGSSGTILKTTSGGVVNANDDFNNYKFLLHQNYPNPFNPTTKIQFRISDFGFVTLKVFDILGREVASLVNEVKSPGEYTVEFNGSRFASGVYFYELKADDFVQSKKMIYLK